MLCTAASVRTTRPMAALRPSSSTVGSWRLNKLPRQLHPILTSTRPGSCSRSAAPVVLCRIGGAGAPGRPLAPPRPGGGGGGRMGMGSKGKYKKGQEKQEVGPAINESIRFPNLRLLGEDNSMLGVVTRDEALEAARFANLDLVLLAPEAEPPVARIMDFGKFRYEQQKKKKDQQRKIAVNRQELKELKMRYNIDVGDYNVRMKQANRFLRDGDKVKVTAQFKGREMDFKQLGMDLFQRFAHDLEEVAVVETKAQMEGRTMFMVLVPNKTALAKAAAAEKKKNQQQQDSEDEAEDSEVQSLATQNGATQAAPPATLEDADSAASSDGEEADADEDDGADLVEGTDVAGLNQGSPGLEQGALATSADSQEVVGTFSKSGG